MKRKKNFNPILILQALELLSMAFSLKSAMIKVLMMNMRMVIMRRKRKKKRRKKKKKRRRRRRRRRKMGPQKTRTPSRRFRFP